MSISVGKYTYGHEQIKIQTFGEGGHVTIGNFCSIAPCQIFVGGDHNTRNLTTYPFGILHGQTFNTPGACNLAVTKGNVTIGHDVWIGLNATIMSGVTIGDGAVIACNSHVVKDVPAYCVVGGNPAQVIRQRFSDSEIEAMLRLQWWFWDNHKINEATPLLCKGDIQAFLVKYDTR